MNATNPVNAAERRRRPGFTLIEVLLAMALLLVVLTGVYAGLETFRRVTTMGREQTAEQQLARAIRVRLLTDLRSLRFAEPEAAADETPADETEGADASSSSSSSSSSSESGGAAAAEPLPVPEVGIVGNAETLTIYTALPGRGMDYSAGVAGTPAARVSDLRTVTWFLAGRGGSVATAVAGRDGTGLARSEGDTAAIAAAESTGDLPGLAAAAVLLAPEVTGLQFRYFDGAGWVDSWDSALSGALPRAVEATLEIDLDGSPSAYAAGDDVGDRAPALTRLLVCPPLSEPSAEAML